MDYPNREWEILEIPVSSMQETVLEDNIRPNGLISCHLGSDTGDRIMERCSDTYHDKVLFVDVEQAAAGLDKVYGCLLDGILSEDSNNHKKGALVIKTAKMGDDIQNPSFFWLIEITD